MTHLELPHYFKVAVKSNENKNHPDFNNSKGILLEEVQ